MNMNNKILVRVIVPCLEQEFEMFIPISKRISEIIKLIEKALNEITHGYYIEKSETLLIDYDTGNVFDINITVKDSKLENGSKIILI